MTAPQIPDAAVEAYLRASSDHARQYPVIEQLEDAARIDRDVTRAGLAAALPHLLPAAPSGETAPPPDELVERVAEAMYEADKQDVPGAWYVPWVDADKHDHKEYTWRAKHAIEAMPAGVAAAPVPAKPDPCGHTIAGIGAQVLICTRPNGHDWAHADMYGAQWSERPTGTDAQATPADPNSCRHCGVPQRSHGQRWVPDAGVHGWTEPTPEQRKQRMLARRRTNAQATPAHLPLSAIQPALDAYRQAAAAFDAMPVGSDWPNAAELEIRVDETAQELADVVLRAAGQVTPSTGPDAQA